MTVKYPTDIEATVTFTKAKKQPVRSGYRPQFHYDGMDWVAIHTFPEHEWVYPGQTVLSHIAFLEPEKHRGKLYAGKQFQLREGRTVVANGSVTRIVELDTRTSRPLEP